MSTIETLIEKVKKLDETRARRLLDWLQGQEDTRPRRKEPLGAQAMLGFARRIHPEPRTTADWMAELRAGERD